MRFDYLIVRQELELKDATAQQVFDSIELMGRGLEVMSVSVLRDLDGKLYAYAACRIPEVRAVLERARERTPPSGKKRRK